MKKKVANEKTNEKWLKRSVRAVRRRINRWTVVLFVVCAALVLILYVSNVIYTDSLLRQIHQQRKELDNLVDANDLMRLKIGQLSSPERIADIAERKLGFVRLQLAPRFVPRKTENPGKDN